MSIYVFSDNLVIGFSLFNNITIYNFRDNSLYDYDIANSEIKRIIDIFIIIFYFFILILF